MQAYWRSYYVINHGTSGVISPPLIVYYIYNDERVVHFPFVHYKIDNGCRRPACSTMVHAFLREIRSYLRFYRLTPVKKYIHVDLMMPHVHSTTLYGRVIIMVAVVVGKPSASAMVQMGGRGGRWCRIFSKKMV